MREYKLVRIKWTLRRTEEMFNDLIRRGWIYEGNLYDGLWMVFYKEEGGKK